MKLKTFLITVALAGCTTNTKPETTGEEANPPSPAMRIEALFPQGRGSGSGSHMGNGQILTNKHVCDMLNEAYAQVAIDYNGNIYKIESMINSKDDVLDLCLVKINEPSSLPVATFEDANVDQNNKLATVIGYPSGMYAHIKGRVMGSTIFLVEDIPEFLTLLGAPSAPGVSGSGVYSSNNKLIGVVNAGNRQITLFIPLTVAKEFYNAALRSIKD